MGPYRDDRASDMTDVERMLQEQEGTGPFRNGRFFLYDDATGIEFKPGDTLVGKLTYGRGYNISDLGIPQDIEEAQFKNNIAIAANDAHKLCSIFDELTRPRQLVLISLAYNLGYLKFSKFVDFWDAIHREDWSAAAYEILDSKAAKKDAPARYRQLARMMRDDFSQWV